MNKREKKKAKEAVKLIEEFEAKQKAEDKKKRDAAEEKARNERVEKVTKRGQEVLGNARDAANTAEKSSYDSIEAAASAKVTATKARDNADDMKDKAAEQVTGAKEAEELKEKETEMLKNVKAESERITASLNPDNFEKANKKYYKGVLKKADDDKKEKEAQKEIEDEKALKEVTKVEGMRNKIEKEWLESEAKKKAAADHEAQDKIEAKRIKELRDW